MLATQALIQRRPKIMRVKFDGKLSSGVTAKDLILALIGHVGAAGGTGYAVEYAGSAIRDMPIEGRLTICNLSIEWAHLALSPWLAVRLIAKLQVAVIRLRHEQCSFGDIAPIPDVGYVAVNRRSDGFRQAVKTRR